MGEYIFSGARFLFFNYVAKTIFSGHNKIWGNTKLGGHCPGMPPVATGLCGIPQCFSNCVLLSETTPLTFTREKVLKNVCSISVFFSKKVKRT